MDFKYLVCIVLMSSVVLMMSWGCDATFGGGSHKKVIIHVPVKYHSNTHTHTIHHHIYQHHHDAEEVEHPKYDEEKKVDEYYGGIEGHEESEEKHSEEGKYDRSDFHVLAKKLVESKKYGHGKPWAMYLQDIERQH